VLSISTRALNIFVAISLVFPLLVRVPAKNSQTRLLSIFLTFCPLFVILSISVEGLFYLTYAAVLVLWVEVETTLWKHTELRRYSKTTDYRPKGDDLRIALFFLFFVQVGKFWIGDINSSVHLCLIGWILRNRQCCFYFVSLHPGCFPSPVLGLNRFTGPSTSPRYIALYLSSTPSLWLLYWHVILSFLMHPATSLTFSSDHQDHCTLCSPLSSIRSTPWSPQSSAIQSLPCRFDNYGRYECMTLHRYCRVDEYAQ
jgi:hypothetical protein